MGKRLLPGLLEHLNRYELTSVLDTFLHRTLPIVGRDKSIILVEVFDKEERMLAISYSHEGDLTPQGKKHLVDYLPIAKGHGLVRRMIDIELYGIQSPKIRKISDFYIVTDMEWAAATGFIPVIEGTKAALLAPIWLGLGREYLVGGMAVDSRDERAFEERAMQDFFGALSLLQCFLFEAFYRKFHEPSFPLDMRVLHRGYLTHFLCEQLFESESYENLHICFLDVNDFKSKNTSYGHLGGNAVLEHFARCLDAESGEYEWKTGRLALPFRYGGDEFAIVMEADSKQEVGEFIKGIDNRLEGAKDLLRQILESRSTSKTKDDDVSIGFSVGVATGENLQPSKELEQILRYVDSLVEDSDEAMFKAKDYARERPDRSVICFKGQAPEPLVSH